MPKDFRFGGDSSSGLPDRLLTHQMIFLILDSIWGFRCTRPMCWWIIKSCCNSQQLEFVEVEYIGRQAAAGSNIHKFVCELGMLWLIMHLHEEWICLKPFPEGNSFGRFATLCQIVGPCVCFGSIQQVLQLPLSALVSCDPKLLSAMH